MINQKRSKKEEQKDQYTLVLEDLRSQFQVFGEQLIGLTHKVDNLEGRFDKLEGRFDNLEGRFDNLEGRLDNLEGSFEEFKTETRDNFKLVFSHFENIEDELTDIKQELKIGIKERRATKEWTQKMEKRVERIEKKLGLKVA